MDTSARADDVEALWLAYGQHRRRDVRDQLIVRYSPLVRAVAGRVAAGLPHSVEDADLVHDGVFGLIDAIDRFEPARGSTFETYAARRIKGAILDGLRARDWVPRSVRSRARAVERTRARLEARYQRTPTGAEVAGALGADSAHLAPVGREVVLVEGAADVLVAADDDPADAYEAEELRHILHDTIGRMPERLRSVLTLYYYEGLTMAAIGRVLGVTESRVCQMHAKAVRQLRSRLTAEHGAR